MGNQHIPIDDYDEDIEFNTAGNDRPDVFNNVPIGNPLDNNLGEEYPYEHDQDDHHNNDDINFYILIVIIYRYMLITHFK